MERIEQSLRFAATKEWRDGTESVPYGYNFFSPTFPQVNPPKKRLPKINKNVTIL